MASERKIRLVAIVAVLALAGFVAFAIVRATSAHTGSFPAVPSPSQLRSGERAPAFRAARLGGGAAIVYAGHSNEPVVMNFFASWCSNCVAELAAFSSVSHATTGTRFVGVDSDDSSPASAMRLLRQAGIAYPVGLDSSGAIADRYLVSALPVTFFIAANGTVKGELFGAASAVELRSWVARLETGAS